MRIRGMRRWTAGLALGVALCARQASAQQAFDPRAELLKIARAKNDEAILASFAESKGRNTPNMTEAELQPIIDTVEKLGHPERAIRMLEDRTRRFPNEIDARVALAKMHVRASDSKGALPVWKEIKARFGLKPEHAIAYARVYSHVGDQANALKVLKEAREKVPDDAKEFWTDLAQAAWESDDTEEAIVAYRKLLKVTPPIPAAASRLMQLLADAGQLDEAIVIAREALVREKNPAHLLFVARLQVKKKDWPAARATLDLAEDQRALVASTLEYWLLRAEVLTQTGDKDGARNAYRTALKLDPNAPGIKPALLWDSIERNDNRTLSVDLRAWLKEAKKDKELWAPVAVGLDRLGQTKEAMPFYLRQMKETPQDFLWVMEVSDALGRAGQETLAARLRRFAFGKLRAASLTAFASPDKRDQKVLEVHAILTHQLRGDPEGERWLRRMIATGKPSAEMEEFAVAWYISDERLDRARRHLARAQVLRLERASLRRYRLLLATADEDRVEIERLLASGTDFTDGELVPVYVKLERDDLAVRPIRGVLDHADLVGDVRVGGNPLLPADADQKTMREELRSIQDRTAPYARIGGDFRFVDQMSAAGPSLVMSHEIKGGRMFYGASGVRLDDTGAASVNVSGLLETDANVLARWIGPRRVTEIGGGVTWQPETSPGVPLPQLDYLEVFQLSKKLAISADLNLHKKIEDTSFLRVVGLRDQITVDVSYEPIRRVYMVGSFLGQEDHTRTFAPLGVEGGGSMDAGFKILEKTPELAVGVRGGAYVRSSRADVPNEYRSIVKRNEGIDALYPPSFQHLLFTIRIAKGDFFERARQERLPFPRYDCEVDGGFLFGEVDAPPAPNGETRRERGSAFAATARCSGAIRMPGGGFLAGIGEYVKGVTGVAEADNARLSLSYTHYLR